ELRVRPRAQRARLAAKSLSARSHAARQTKVVHRVAGRCHEGVERRGKADGAPTGLEGDAGLRRELLLPGKARPRQGRVQSGDGGGLSRRDAGTVSQDAPGARGKMIDKLKRNKENAMAFYDLMFNQCKPREAMERFAGARYTQHNPHVGDGKEP